MEYQLFQLDKVTSYSEMQFAVELEAFCVVS